MKNPNPAPAIDGWEVILPRFMRQPGTQHSAPGKLVNGARMVILLVTYLALSPVPK